jgi:hypothetical protein
VSYGREHERVVDRLACEAPDILAAEAIGNEVIPASRKRVDRYAYNEWVNAHPSELEEGEGDYPRHYEIEVRAMPLEALERNLTELREEARQALREEEALRTGLDPSRDPG